MISSANVEVLVIGIAVAAELILGLVVFANNRHSITNRFFLLFAVVDALWGATAYFVARNYLPTYSSAEFQLWASRFTIFFATFQAYSFLALMYVSPSDRQNLKPVYKRGLLLLAIMVSIVTLSPYAFSTVIQTSSGGPHYLVQV